MTPILTWRAADQEHQAIWRSEAGLPVPACVEVVDDSLGADEAYRRMAAGSYLLWCGDWVNARHLMQALTRRVDRRIGANRTKAPKTPAEAFEQHRRLQGERAALLARFLVPLASGYVLPLRRGQDVHEALCMAWGADGVAGEYVLAMREMLAVISAAEWRKKGVPVPAVQGRIYPHYGVFSPVRGEYVDLLANEPLPDGAALAFDIGVGSGILSAVLARRGIERIVAIDQDDRALGCAIDNIERLGLAGQVEVRKGDLFPEGRADLIVCNPPWVPAQPSSPIEYAVYDPDSHMLKGFLAGLAKHLRPEGEGWLIISDIAERLGLRRRDELLAWISSAGLVVVGRSDTRPRHPKAKDRNDPLYQARSTEITSLWRLRAA